MTSNAASTRVTVTRRLLTALGVVGAGSGLGFVVGSLGYQAAIVPLRRGLVIDLAEVALGLVCLATVLVIAALALTTALACLEPLLALPARLPVPGVAQSMAGLLLGLTVVAAPAASAAPSGVGTSLSAQQVGPIDPGFLPAADTPTATPSTPLPDPAPTPTATDTATSTAETAPQAAATTPEAPTASAAPTTRLKVSARIVDGRLTVVRGDTLWDLAADTLGSQASDEAIATEWHRWWLANRDLVGADPDLLLPGQILDVPEGQAR